jgi:hypothetical protein
MATLTEMVAAVVVHSSAAAFSHFGVVIDTPKVEQPRPAAVAADRRTIARSPRQAQRAEKVEKASVCPDAARARLLKA